MTETITRRRPPMNEEQAKHSREFREKNDELSPQEADMIDSMATISGIIHRMLFILSQADNAARKGFNRRLYGIKKAMDRDFPMDRDGMSLSDMCPICVEGDDPNTCQHAPYIRAALLLMGLLRIHAETDLDEPEDEPPDPNEGMVSTEES